jgi:hypothetical protein
LAIHQSWSILCAILLIALTWPVWLPPNANSFPQIPMAEFLVDFGPIWDLTGLAGLTISLLSVLLISMTRLKRIAEAESTGGTNWSLAYRLGLLAVIGFGTLLVCLNQHRLQAWFYQLLLFCVAWLLKDARLSLRWLQWLVISIYAYSAFSKLDYEFLNSVGQDFLMAGLSPLGVDVTQWSRADRVVCASMMPIVELSLAIGLVWERCRRPIGWLAAAFHLLLACLLGFQMQHSWGVVIWNLQFAVQAAMLFGLQRSVFASEADLESTGFDFPKGRAVEQPLWSRGGQLLCQGLLWIAVIMPVAERWGYWDHWPSWALYAPHTSRTKVWIAPNLVEDLPVELRNVVGGSLVEPGLDATGVEIPLDRWSLEELNVPIYPQSRFQLGVAVYLADYLDTQRGIHAEICSAADRWDGYRSVSQLADARQIEKAETRFWLNVRPRRPRLPESLKLGFGKVE